MWRAGTHGARSPAAYAAARAAAKPAYAVDPARPVTPLTYEIGYIDANTTPSYRRIDIRSVSAYEAWGYVDAWCHLRRAERSFRIDRITDMVSVLTGEVVSSPVAHLKSVVRKEFDPGPDYRSVLDRARRGLRALIWIARSDNELSEAEMDLLVDYIDARNRLSGDKFAGAEWNRVVAMRWVENERPVMNEAKGGLSRLSAASKESALIREFAAKLVSISGYPDEKAEKRRRALGL